MMGCVEKRRGGEGKRRKKQKCLATPDTGHGGPWDRAEGGCAAWYRRTRRSARVMGLSPCHLRALRTLVSVAHGRVDAG